MSESTENMKQWINNQNYETLLRRWRFAEYDDPYFQGEIGQYYKDVMFTKKSLLSNSECVSISKRVGWDK
jgi:hypothetical protein